jgi:hypothetical protein
MQARPWLASYRFGIPAEIPTPQHRSVTRCWKRR